MNSTILLTGATGRIGPYVLEALIRRGFSVRVATPDPVPETAEISWVETDFLNAVDYKRLVSGMDAVLHLAAELWEPSRMALVNVDATDALARAASLGGVRRFVYASTVGVYGFPEKELVDEAAPTLSVDGQRNSPYFHEPYLKTYSITKLQGEWALKQRLSSKMQGVILRLANVTSEHDIRLILTTWGLWKKMWRGYRRTHQVYVKDVADAFVFALSGDSDETLSTSERCEVFNVSEDSWEGGRYVDLFRDYGEAKGCKFCGCPFVVPRTVDFLKDRWKFRSLSRALPPGALLYSAEKLTNAGFKLTHGIRNIQRQVIRNLVNSV